MKNQKSILIKNGTIVTLGEKNKVLTGHALLIENGLIKKIAPQKSFKGKYAKVIDAAGKVVMPGFINAHMHFYSTFARGLGKAAPSRNFTEILSNLWWRLDKKLTTQDSYYSAVIPLIDAVRKGTACWSIDDETLITMRAKGIKFVGVFCKDNSDIWLTHTAAFFDRGQLLLDARCKPDRRYMPLGRFRRRAGRVRF